MRYVVTGGLGFIGSHLAHHLVGLGHEVTVVDTRDPTGIAAPGAECIRADVADRGAMRSVVRGSDGVFHLAALTSAPESVSRPAEYERVNVGGTQAVLGAAALAGAPIVLASSAAVYGNAGGPVRRPLAEDAACEPANPYGATKLECERILSTPRPGGLAPSFPGTVSLRLFNAYGPALPGATSTGVVARFAARLAARLRPVVSGDGQQVRDFVHVEDIARAFAAAMQMAAAAAAGPHGAFNVGTGRGIEVASLAHAMARAAGLEGARAEPGFGPATPGDVEYSVADTRRAADALGWRASIALDEGLRRLLAESGGGGRRPGERPRRRAHEHA